MKIKRITKTVKIKLNKRGTDILKVLIIETILEFEKKFISSGFVFIENQKDIQDNNKNISTNKL